MDFNNGNNANNGNNNEAQPFYSTNPYSQPQGQPQDGYQGQPQGGYQGQPQGGYQGQPQGGYQSQYQGTYNSPQGQGVPVHTTSQRNGGEYNPQADMYNPYGQMPEQKPSANACQIISLILGILSIVCCCFGIISVLFAIAGIILAIVGNKKQKHGVGTGGLVCSIIGLVLSLIILAISLAGSYAAPRSMDEIFDYIEELEDF